MNKLLFNLHEQLAAGLARKSASTTSRWAQLYVHLGQPFPGPFSFKHHPWSKEMMDTDCSWDGMKAAQMAFTTSALIRCMRQMDHLGIDVLYILPKRTPDASDFSKAKFDAILEKSPYLTEMFSNVRNVGHKQAGAANFYLRGARSRSGLKQISAGMQVQDEFDEFPKGMAQLAEQRGSGYSEELRQLIRLSTPTVPDYGIHAAIKLSTREHYFFKCPSCSRRTELVYPDCLVVTADSIEDEDNLRKSHLICKECHNILPHQAKPEWLSSGLWVPSRKANTRGFEISQLYSMAVHPWEIAKQSIKARDGDDAEDIELHNSRLGLPRLTRGARVSESQILECVGNYYIKEARPNTPQLITMGVDVGKFLHCQISQWLLPETLGNDLNVYAVKRVLCTPKLEHFEELDHLLYEYQILHTVIDPNPETRKASEFAERHAGRVTMCYFFRGLDTRKQVKRNEETHTIGVHRASWLDLSQGRFLKKSILLPRDISQEYKSHINNLIKRPEKDKDGNPIARYMSVGVDHYALANMYDEVALPLAASGSQGGDINVYL